MATFVQNLKYEEAQQFLATMRDLRIFDANTTGIAAIIQLTDDGSQNISGEQIKVSVVAGKQVICETFQHAYFAISSSIMNFSSYRCACFVFSFVGGKRERNFSEDSDQTDIHQI